MQALMDHHQEDLDAAYRRVTADVPLRRPASSDEIAAVCQFLVGAEASIVTGAGRTVLVTGAAGGIGQAIVEGFARGGAQVLAVDLDSPALRRLVDAQRALGHDVRGETLDLADPVAINTLLAKLERLDVLVHNAAYFPLTTFAEIDPALLQRTLAVAAACWLPPR
ncbi:hypothetical protein WR25_03112 [Diploscapter pachys]|uniref:Dehydrogenase/reductase SDR family member 6 n=1 Tax=Diploscapter pachys TaxID=2018661 RepID=A0A2A2KK14_9BILA|nr:hypothetical protein WR25_03112 [Diploscapter pachys]